MAQYRLHLKVDAKVKNNPAAAWESSYEKMGNIYSTIDECKAVANEFTFAKHSAPLKYTYLINKWVDEILLAEIKVAVTIVDNKVE